MGTVLGRNGAAVVVGTQLSPDELSELHYQTALDANGAAGFLRYRAVDEDGVSSESSVRLFVDPVNDAPRFATSGFRLVIAHTVSSDAVLYTHLTLPTKIEVENSGGRRQLKYNKV